jgi:hypothetical protein
MPGYVARWFIEGDVDWDAWNEQLQRAGPLLAGALFGAGWCCWLDSMIYQAAVVGVSTPFKYQGPGIAASIALVAINMIPRRELADEAWEEGAEVSQPGSATESQPLTGVLRACNPCL